jgi:outer membrane scaffolding protein for murein synthesis (MipA/OmpV family)
MTESLKVFEDLMLSRNDNVSPVFGTIYLYMMSINYELGQSKEIRRLFDELKQSSIINKEEILEEVRYQELIR